MKIVRLDYNDKEDLEFITVKMTHDQAVGLVNLLGALNGKAHSKLDINSDMYECLSSVFNMHYDNGYPAKGIHLDTLND